VADNVTLPGTGEPIATDDISGVQYQRVKLTDGAADSVAHMRVKATNPLADDEGAIVRQAPADVWSASFSRVGSALMETDKFTQRRAGTGVGVSQSAGNLVLTTGTTANSEYLARSIASWRGAFIARHKTILSQRIANQSFIMLLADLVGEGLNCTINSATSITVTIPSNPFTAANVGQQIYVGAINGAAGVPGRYSIASVSGNNVNFTVSGWPASGSCTVDLFGWNYVRTAYSGTSATSAAVDAQRNGWNSGDTSANINNTASPGHVMQVYADGRNINWSDTLVASSLTPNVNTRASRIEALPDDDVPLYWFIWMVNGTTAPASTTTWTIGFCSVEDNANVPTYIAGIRPIGAQSTLPVRIADGQSSLFLSTGSSSIGFVGLNAGTNLAGDVGHQYRANATGAASRTHIVSAASTNATQVKSAGAGRVLGWYFVNNSASWRYVKLHNQTALPTAGTGVVQTIGVPPNGVARQSLEGGIAFTTGIALTIVSGAADADATAIGANEVAGDIFWA
jgi:hypothetical protein